MVDNLNGLTRMGSDLLGNAGTEPSRFTQQGKTYEHYLTYSDRPSAAKDAKMLRERFKLVTKIVKLMGHKNNKLGWYFFAVYAAPNPRKV
jgi:hypothetical protein